MEEGDQMLIKLDLQSEVPIYLQLRNQIIEGIATKKLQPGEALPSVRQLGIDLGINFHTVNKAYSILKQDGFILVHRQKGVVVNTGPMPGIDANYIEALENELEPIVAEAYCRGMTSLQFSEISERLFSKLKLEGGEKNG